MSSAEQKALMDDDELQKVKNYALKLLSFRPRSSFELKKKLDFYILKKKLPPNLTSVVLKDLKKINDKQMKKLSLETDRRLLIEKLKMHLLRRGFSWSVTHKVIDSKMGKS